MSGYKAPGPLVVVTVSDWHCCNIDYHKCNTLDRNKQYISKNKVWSGTIFWKPFAVVRPTFPFPDCFLFRTVRLQRPGISLWLISPAKNDPRRECRLDWGKNVHLALDEFRQMAEIMYSLWPDWPWIADLNPPLKAPSPIRKKNRDYNGNFFCEEPRN